MTSVEMRGWVPSSAGFLFMMLMSVSGARTRIGLPPGEPSSYGALRAVSGVWGNAPERRRGVPFISCRGGGSNPHGRASTGARRADRKRAGGWIVGGQGAVRCLVLMRLRCPAKLFASCPELAFGRAVGLNRSKLPPSSPCARTRRPLCMLRQAQTARI